MNDDQHLLPLVFPQDMPAQRVGDIGEADPVMTARARISPFDDHLREVEEEKLYKAISIYLEHHNVFKKA